MPRPRRGAGQTTADPATPLRHPHAAWFESWPSPVAIPLREYLVVKLWAACDTVEMLLRLLVIARLAERAQEGGLPEPLRRRLTEIIETPTLGAWFLMAQALAEHGSKEPLLAEANTFINGPLRDLLYGPSKPGTPETSFLRLRNRLAHGGGLTRKEAAPGHPTKPTKAPRESASVLGNKRLP